MAFIPIDNANQNEVESRTESCLADNVLLMSLNKMDTMLHSNLNTMPRLLIMLQRKFANH